MTPTPTGSEVAAFRPGDRVMCPFTANCGSCFYCRRGLTARCVCCLCCLPVSRWDKAGWKSASSPLTPHSLLAPARRCERSQPFGWVQGGRGLQGAQAQYVRVPLADATLVAAPDDVSDEECLLLGDILSTGAAGQGRACSRDESRACLAVLGRHQPSRPALL